LDEKTTYEKRLEAQLRDWQRRIEALREKSDGMEEDRRSACRDHLHKLEHRHADMQATLDKLRSSRQNTFGDVRKASDKAWTDMENAVSKALIRFN